MTMFTPHTWEQPLLMLAREAVQSMTTHVVSAPIRDRAELARAYAHCEAITAHHSRSFFLASTFLSADKRRALRALYAFCRVTDDIVDCAHCEAENELMRWRHQSLAINPPHADRVAVAWADARLRYRIPVRYAEQLIDGVARDLTQHRYQTFDDLAAYAYGVASTVGLMSMHIIGFSGPEAIPYAIKLGVALQLTNILRDVAEDWQAGRVYLPAAELAEFDLSEADLDAGRVDNRWRGFMHFQIERNRRLYAEAWPGIAMLNKDGRFAVAAAAGLYRAILDDIEAHDYDIFSRRAHVNGARKLSKLPGLWWHNR
ncbi:MAG: squalene/phytoene synthase family protein [Anaerolineae bacterium]